MAAHDALTPYEKSVLDRHAAARAQRAEGGSLADYGLREQKEWLGGQSVRPDGSLTVYRAMREQGDIVPGDYVTNAKTYAQAHIENNLDGEGVIVEVQAHLDEIFPADGPKEFWYLPRSLDATAMAEAEHTVVDEKGKPIDMSYYWSEGCAAFALHLAREIQSRNGQARIAVLSNPNGEAWSDDFDYELTHVVVVTENGYVDVNGLESDPTWLATKIGLSDFEIKGPWDVDDFEARFVGEDDDKPLYGADEAIETEIDCLIEARPSLYALPASKSKLRP